MKKNLSVGIIGGGLAGLTAAIHLSSNGVAVTLFEKGSYPSHKVCGEYVSNEVLGYLDSLGITPLEAGAKKINRFQFTTVSGKSVEVPLPLGGFGISRYCLDELLYLKAVENGVEVQRNTVTAVEFKMNQFEVHAKNDQSFCFDVVLGAFGKRSILDKSLSRKFMEVTAPWLGVKAHYQSEFPSDLVALHNFDGGYCGLSKVEDESINVCYLADYKTFKKYKSLQGYQTAVLEKNPYLKEFFATSKLLFETPLTISQISFAPKKAVENHVLMIGDSAGLIHPLCGNGMAMGIHSAKIACEAIDESIRLNASRDELEKNYSKQWQQVFNSRMQMGRLIQKGLQQRTTTAIGVSLLQRYPSALRKLIQLTHGAPI